MRYELSPTDPAAAAEFGRAIGVSATIAQLLMQRGVTTEAAARDFLSPSLAGLSAPDAMCDRMVAARRLAQAVREQAMVVVFGDYDVDGTTSAALMAEGLLALGGRVEVVIADRFHGGYGFSQTALERVLALAPGLVVTCDCGSSDHARLAQLKEREIDAIVVDHHLVPDEPLPVGAFLNPHRPECEFPFKGMCSAGLAFSLVAAVRKELGATLDMRPFLDLVALGTIADVAPLTDDNRRLVRAGLRLLGTEQARPGIVALRELAKIRVTGALAATDVSFRLTPRLNAPGRLGDQGLSLALLRARTSEEAQRLAGEVEARNNERKERERAVTAAAVDQVLEHYGEAPDCGVVVASADFHPGVVGISAARLVDRFRVPAIVATLSEPHGHGSGRAPAGFPLYDAIAACADTLVRFGGHQAASGVTLAPEALDAFRARFAESTRKLQGSAKVPPERVDLTLGAGPFTLPTATELSLLEPLGEGNPEPRFYLREVAVVDAGEVGQGHLKLRVRVGATILPAFGFELAAAYMPARGESVQLVGALRPDTYRGGDAVELRIEQVGPSDGPCLLLSEEPPTSESVQGSL